MEVNVENLMKTAIAEMENGQHSEAAKHFDLVVINDSENIEAPFYRAYCNCYDIKIGDMPNAATNFTSAFCRYVNEVKKLNDPAAEKEKFEKAATMLKSLLENYEFNGLNVFLTSRKVALSVFEAARMMGGNCRNKLESVNANVSADTMEAIAKIYKSLKGRETASEGYIILGIILAVAAAVGWFVYMSNIF